MKLKLIMLIALIAGASQFTIAQEQKKEEVFKWYQVQEKAQFPGGAAAFDQYIIDNMKIPDKAYRKAKNGTILVSFIVEKDGSITNVRITSKKAIGYGCEKAAINVIKKMPPWTPAMQQDAPCRMAFTKPIRLNFT